MAWYLVKHGENFMYLTNSECLTNNIQSNKMLCSSLTYVFNNVLHTTYRP